MASLFAALILGGWTGCGAPADGPATAAAPASDPRPVMNACRLMTFSQAEQIAEVQLRGMRTALDQPSGPDFAKCSYGSPDQLGKTISLELRKFASAEVATEVQESSKSRLRSLAGGDLADVAGIGDEAFWGDGRLDQLHVRRGELRVILTLTMGPEAGRREAAVGLVRTALERLDRGEASEG